MKPGTQSKRRRIFQWALRVLLLLFVVGLVSSWYVAKALVAASPREVSAPHDLPMEEFSIPSDSGSTIAGWHLPGDGDGVIVLLHGIRGTRSSMVPRARMFGEAGYSVVMIDLQAHGESPGEVTTLGHLERHDVRAAVAYAKRLHPREPVAVIGASLGGAAALLASPLEIEALILESVYPTIDSAVHNRVANQLGPHLGWLPAELLLVQLEPRLGVAPEELRPVDRIAGVGCPVLVLSGNDDAHTTAEDTDRLFSRAREPKELWIIPGVAHEDLFAKRKADYRVRVMGFLSEHMPGR